MVRSWKSQSLRRNSHRIFLHIEKLEDRRLFSTSPGLVAAWGFEEISGNIAADGSGNLNSGVIENADWSNDGRFGNAVHFNGVDARVIVDDAVSLDLTTEVTLEAWVRPSAVSDGWPNIISQGPAYYLVASSDPLVPILDEVISVDGTFYGGAFLAANIWTHLALTYDGEALRLYVDGSQVANRPQWGPITTSNGAVTVGGESLDGHFFEGWIDEVRIYNRALSVTEIQTDMNAPVVDSSLQMTHAAPLVFAGPRITVDLEDTALLSGEAMSITYRGLEFGWSKASGPGNVMFGDPHSPVSSAHFSAAGIYDLTLTVSNEFATASDHVVVAVVSHNLEEVLTTNRPLTIGEGAMASINSDVLLTTDADDTTAELVYTITSGPSNGTLKRSGSTTTSFTQADINAGLITYQHNGSETTSDSFAFSVNDGQGTSSSGTFQVIVTSTVSIPELDTWLEDMLIIGRQHGEWLLAHQNDAAFDPPLLGTYYDAARVFYQIADYTGDDSWNAYAEAAVHVYRDRYVIPNNGGVPGYWNFTRGLVLHYEKTGDVTSKNAVIMMSESGAYTNDAVPLEWTENQVSCREVAYAIMSYLDAERVGAPRRDRLEDMFEQALGHLDQWFVQGDLGDFQPFYFGLTADALMQYYERVDPDPRILEKLQAGATWMWNNAWVAADESFWYSAADQSHGAPDLNLLIVPVYEWLHQQTGNNQFRDQADQIFAGGVRGAWLSGAKQFNQNYRVSFDYVAMRQSQPNPLGQAAVLQQVVVPADLVFTELGTKQFGQTPTIAAWSIALESDETAASAKTSIELETSIDSQLARPTIDETVPPLDFLQWKDPEANQDNFGIDLINLLTLEDDVLAWVMANVS